MSEPKKSLIEAAAKRLWPNLTAVNINQRKHSIRVTFAGSRGKPGRKIELAAGSHRELLARLSVPQAGSGGDGV